MMFIKLLHIILLPNIYAEHRLLKLLKVEFGKNACQTLQPDTSFGGLVPYGRCSLLWPLQKKACVICVRVDPSDSESDSNTWMHSGFGVTVSIT